MNNDIVLPQNTEQMKDFLKESCVDFNSDDSFTASCKMALVITKYRSKVKDLTRFIDYTYPDDEKYISSAYAEYYKAHDDWKVTKYVFWVGIASFFIAIFVAGLARKLSLLLFIPIIMTILAKKYKKYSLKKKWINTDGKEMLERKNEHLDKVPQYSKERYDLNRRLTEMGVYLADFVDLNFNSVPEQYWGDAKALLEIYSSRRAFDISQAINILEQDKAMKRLNDRITAAESRAASAETAANFAQQSADEALAEATGRYYPPRNY